MKEKDIIKGEALERIDNELFSSFDPEEESCIGGGPYTITASATFTPNGYDAAYDYDIVFADLDG